MLVSLRLMQERLVRRSKGRMRMDRSPVLVAAAAYAVLTMMPPLQAEAQTAAVPRIAAVPQSRWSDALRAAAAVVAPLGMTNLVAVYANYPELAEVLLPHLHYVFAASTLPPRHRALLGLRAAWLTRSDYLWAHWAAAARRAGFTDTELVRVAKGPDAAGWKPFEAALLQSADELIVDSFISDATWAALSKRYDVSQLIDVIDTVGATTLHAGAAKSLAVALESSATDHLPRGVPYAPAAKRTNVRLIGAKPRIPPVPPKDGSRITANVFNTFVRNPRADRVRGAVNAHVNSHTALTARQRDLLITRMAVLCRGEYEYAAHLRTGRRAGMDDADVAHVLAGPDKAEGANPVDIALLRAADELYRDSAVSAATWKALAATFDMRQMLDVLVTVGAYRSGGMLINSAGVQLDASMADYRFPASLR